MKVLIVDTRLGARQAVQDIVRDYHQDSVGSVILAADGSQALNLITDSTFDVIITSNQLRGYSGANLLQAISRNEKPARTLLHSTNPTGYIVLPSGHQGKIDLAAHVALFDFAEFAIKDVGFTYIRQFLEDTDILSIIAPPSI